MYYASLPQKSELRYYEAILARPLTGFEHALAFLKGKCDSRLEIAFALSLLEKTSFGDPPEIDGDWIRLPEPFSSSPTGNGSSVAWLQCQKSRDGELWDFAISIGFDNGALQVDSSLKLLVDIDGFGSHQNRRQYDLMKVNSMIDDCIKLPEENFKSVDDMAETVLFASIWTCECGGGPEIKSCRYHRELLPKSIHRLYEADY